MNDAFHNNAFSFAVLVKQLLHLISALVNFQFLKCQPKPLSTLLKE